MKNLKEIISQLDTVTPCVLNPLFLRHNLLVHLHAYIPLTTR